MSEEENYSPYCEICSACGETGCCPVYMCTMEDGCKYKETHLRELKESYSLMEEFYKHIYNKLPQDLKEEFDKIEDKNFEYWYGKERTDS
jgi:hypothetical protein